jgi:hypothetical protein
VDAPVVTLQSDGQEADTFLVRSGGGGRGGGMGGRGGGMAVRGTGGRGAMAARGGAVAVRGTGGRGAVAFRGGAVGVRTSSGRTAVAVRGTAVGVRVGSRGAVVVRRGPMGTRAVAVRRAPVVVARRPVVVRGGFGGFGGWGGWWWGGGWWGVPWVWSSGSSFSVWPDDNPYDGWWDWGPVSVVPSADSVEPEELPLPTEGGTYEYDGGPAVPVPPVPRVTPAPAVVPAAPGAATPVPLREVSLPQTTTYTYRAYGEPPASPAPVDRSYLAGSSQSSR